ncbi:TonB-dependent receptor domain-containing protein [Sphingomonas soli]|uniref:TonB-dependent receptor domain-containing protein n=1 Tax=Sphingomonas soli TaxID=266127 RepID=UPI0008378FB3|nr:TonB-dependent receptor [Sphingomonas soli]
MKYDAPNAPMLRPARRATLAIGTAAIALMASAPAFAQTADEPAAAEGAAASEDEITVTGSRIRGVAPVGSPLLSLGREEINSSGAVTTDRMLRELPQVFDLGVSENSRGQSGGSSNITYGNSVNLRGIGPYATLVLVNGHRVVGNTRSVDPSIIPTLGLERVEVVADGASAIYGSDAVAGVVNLIPRRSLDGIEAVARVGKADNFHESLLGIAGGKTWDTGQVMLAYEHVYRSNLAGADRDFFVNDQRPFGGRDYRVNQCDPGTIVLAGTNYAIPQGGVTATNRSALVAGTQNLCDSNQGQDLFPQTDYDSFTGTFSQEVTPWLTLLADGFWSKRNFYRKAPYATATLTVPSTNAFFVSPPGTTPASETIRYNFVGDLPNDNTYGFTRTWQLTGGARAKLPYAWELQAYYSYGKTLDRSDSVRGINNGALNAALASSNPATAFDPFGLHRTSAAVLAAISDQIFLAPTYNKLQTYQVSLDGPLFDIGGNKVRLAVGYEGQKIRSDLGIARGAPTTPLTYRTFRRGVDSFYGELYLPLFGDGNAMPGLEKLQFNAAVRHDRYSDVGETTNPKFGIVWSPVRGLEFRGSYGTSFRAPIFSQIFGNSNGLYVQNYVDPTLGSTLVTGIARSGANPDLKPENAKTWTLGADYRHGSNFRASLTYFDVLYEGQATAYLSDLTILGRESDFAGLNIIYRGAAAAAQVAALSAAGIGFVGAPPANITLYVDGRNLNLGKSVTRGIDLELMYRLDAGSAGAFTFNANGTYLTDYRVAVSPTAPLKDFRNTIFNPLTFKSRASLTWDLDPASVRVQWNHVGGYRNTLITPNEDISAYDTFDIAVNYTVGDRTERNFFKNGFTLSLEARNLFDRNPPYVNLAPSGNGSGGYDATVTNPIGRLLSVAVRKTW